MPRRRWHDPPVSRWFADAEFQAAFDVALAASHHGAADVEEVLTTAARIEDGHTDSWVHEWLVDAGEVWAAAVAAETHGLPHSARAHHRRAATYYAAALAVVNRSSEPEREPALLARHDECWNRSCGPSISVPGGRLFLAGGDRRATVVVATGRPLESEAHVRAGAAAAARGHHWATTDDDALPVLIDALSGDPHVREGGIAVIGLGAGAANAAAVVGSRPHRIAAAVLDPPVHVEPQRLSTPVLTHRPGRVLSASAREAAVFDWLEAHLR
ncbi:MAG TPA: hypothetical protein VMT10_05820 [Solirubrobacteraceae bacterium]|nr:hypothetical protein [Solirubrobacteraceae bacterium]